MPEDGEYTATVTKCSKGVSTKNDPEKPMFWWKPTARIEAGDNIDKVLGQEFSLGFFNTNAPGIMKREARALNGGEAVPFNDLNSIFLQSVGKVLRIKVATTTSSKNGKEYTNCYIQEVIQTEDVPATAEEPPQGETLVDDGGNDNKAAPQE